VSRTCGFLWGSQEPLDLPWPVLSAFAVGPTFWFGGTVNDPNSLFGQAFEELQFYPNALVSNCTPNGGFVVSNVPGDYTICSPVWTIKTTGQKPNFHEPAAFNAMLTSGSSNAPLVMHAGDTIQVHYFVTAAKDGWHINVRDLTTGQSGTIVLNSKSDGPLMPTYDTQEVGNSLKWGAVHDTPGPRPAPPARPAAAPSASTPGTRRTPTGRSAMASTTRPPRTTSVR
jgi:hypothetical protein